VTNARTNFPLSLVLIAALVAGACGLAAQPVITEWMASNSHVLADQDGAYSDWIELHNPGETGADLTGWYLTDSAENKVKWPFPPVTIAPGGYLVVFASGKDRRDPSAQLHTNFALSASGEYLALVMGDGVTPAFEITYPAQPGDVSYGRPAGSSDGGSTLDFLDTPTPGAANSAARSAAIQETVTFSRPAGIFRNSISVELSGAGANQRIRYVITPATGGAAAPVPTATSPVYSRPLAISQSVVVRAAVFSGDGASGGSVATAHYVKLGASVSNFSSPLPVLVIDSLGSGPLVKDGIDHRSWIYSFAPRGNGAPTFAAPSENASPLTTSVRGSSSAEFPKKSYTLKLTGLDGSGQAKPLLDLPAYEKWALIGPWSFDFSYINNAVVYALSNQLGRWAPRTRFAEVFLNAGGDDLDSADYAGIYALTDRIEVGRGRVDLKKLSASERSGEGVTGGYILKFDHPDPDEIAWQTTRGNPPGGTSSLVLVYPKAEDVAPEQLTYLRDYVQEMESALYAGREGGWSQRSYLDYIDRGSWVDHHLLNTFACNPDAFQKSAYFTKDRGGKLHAGPVWDFDRALGSYWDERSFRWDLWSGVGGTDFWRNGWWGVIAEDPEFMQDWVDRWQDLRGNALSNSSLIQLIESQAAQVGQDAVSRDADRWPDNRSPYGTYAAQIDRLKGWMTLRAEWIDQQFVPAPTAAVSGASITFAAPAGAQLAYTVDGSDPRALGGEVAATAILSSSPLTVPASTNIHVRSYRADRRGVFPGSPWSSATAGDSSSPLRPVARMVNLSSRAIVGTGEDALIAGVVVADTAGKRYLSRAIGPGLAAFGATGILPDPQLGIFNGGGVEIFRNNGWESGAAAALLPEYSRSVGAFPLAPGSMDSALVNALGSGAYTLQITTPSERSGLALAELYELDANGRTVNLSTRARVRTGDGALIGGFVVRGPAYKRMLLRAVGPTLTAFGVSDALLDPVLTLYSGQSIVASNDRWESAQNLPGVIVATRTAGAFHLAPSSEDAVLLITLPPGAYTVEVRGKDDAEGVALLEIYDLP
jgi:hypothetical protein